MKDPAIPGRQVKGRILLYPGTGQGPCVAGWGRSRGKDPAISGTGQGSLETNLGKREKNLGF